MAVRFRRSGACEFQNSRQNAFCSAAVGLPMRVSHQELELDDCCTGWDDHGLPLSG